MSDDAMIDERTLLELMCDENKLLRADAEALRARVAELEEGLKAALEYTGFINWLPRATFAHLYALLEVKE